MKKKIRLSVLGQVALLFIISALFATLLTSGLSRRLIMDFAAAQGRVLATTAGTAVKIAIGSKDGLYTLMEDEDFQKTIHRDLRYICRSTEIRNLYIYTIDENEKKHYMVIASSDDEEDAKMNRLYGYGSKNSRPIYQAERNVMNGDMDGDYEFIENEYGRVFLYVLPITDDDGSIICFIGVDYSIETITDIERDDLQVFFALRLLLLGFVFLISLILTRNILLMPLQSLSREMRNFVKNRDHGRISIREKALFEDEISDIENSFDEMVLDISKYLKDIEDLTKEQVQTQTQLEVARSIQNSMMPEDIFVGPGYDIFGFEKPAREVGGDFYDIFIKEDDHICIVVGDISGKGISAALLMVMVKTELREKLKAGRSPADSLMEINQDICSSNPENMFATVFVSVLNTKTGVLSYANAGHDLPVFLSDNPYFMKVNPGTAIGLFEDITITEDEIRLENGEGILIYTDGITESIDKNRNMFGEERLQASIRSSFMRHNETYYASSLVNDVLDEVKAFCGEEEQFDDITCTAIIFGKELSSFECFKRAILESLGESDHTKEMVLACEEMYTNVINYSGADNVYFSGDISQKTFSVILTDNGIPFDPVNAAVQEKDFEDLDTGGMGIMLAKLYSREMIYRRDKERNILTLKFDVI